MGHYKKCFNDCFLLGCALFVSITLFGCASRTASSNASDFEIFLSSSSAAPAANSQPTLMQKMRNTYCNATSLQGSGIGDDELQAREAAYLQISMQIKSSINFNQKTRNTAAMVDGEESIQRDYSMSAETETRLVNAEAVKIVLNVTEGSKTGIVACLERDDAVKPYVKMMSDYRDSINMAGFEVVNNNHPIKKKEAYGRMLGYYAKSDFARGVVEGLGKTADGAATLGDSVLTDYRNYKLSYGLSVENISEESPIAIKLVETFQNVVSFEEARPNGVKVVFSSDEPVCNEGSFGINCQAKIGMKICPVLGESCYVEYSEEVKGVGRDEEDSRQKVVKNIDAQSSIIKKWTDEISKWKL
ncbi:MAG: hypothetical protein HUK20_00120 [Fibrobacter sp.]|nr:hypothetical protein [Fibrobacter sp.]